MRYKFKAGFQVPVHVCVRACVGCGCLERVNVCESAYLYVCAGVFKHAWGGQRVHA